MPEPFFDYKTIPTGSILLIPQSERLPYISATMAIPDSIHKILSSPAIGSYVRGLTRTFNLPLEKAPLIALQILIIGIGKKPMAQLAGLLSSSLAMPNDKAQAMAKDIEKELFASVMLDLNAFITKQKQQGSQPPAGASNIINLKNPSTPPLQAVPPKPFPPA